MIEPVPDIYVVRGIDFLSLSILVLWLGSAINRAVPVLQRNSIPAAVTGGVLFSSGTAGYEIFSAIDVQFDMRLRDLLLLVFFSTIGLKARFNRLAAGGFPLVILVALAGAFLIAQNVVGVSLAALLGHIPAYGLMAGSISFSGGHGTTIAWGQEAAAAGMMQAEVLGVAFATLGLIAGGVVGGPLSRYLIRRNQLTCDVENMSQMPSAKAERIPRPDDKLFHVQRTLLLLALCVSLGDLVNRYLFSYDILLPGFLTAMLSGILLTNTLDGVSRPLKRETIDQFGDVSLGMFLAMSLMSMNLLPLLSMGIELVLFLVAQITLTLLFCIFIVFPLLGRNYDAAVICAGFSGLGLGATPVAIANMDAITQRSGPSEKAFLIVPLVGAFFIDMMNAATIKFFLSYFPFSGG